MEAFHDYAHYYNVFYGDKDYAAEAKTVGGILRQYGKKNAEKKILSIGCGTGRHDVELYKLGYKIHGIDLSAEMVDIARKNALDQNFIYEVQDARNFMVKQPYDFIVSLFHVMSYQNTNADLGGVFSCVSKALNPGGLFVFDAWYGPGVLSDKPSVRVKRVVDSDYFFIRIAEPLMHPNENIVSVQYEVNVIHKREGNLKQIKETHTMRYFFKPEIEELLKQNGMKLIDCIDCNTLKTPDFHSWTVYFVAEKC